MSKIIEIVKKDLKVFYFSPQAAIVLAGVVLIAGYLFLNYLGHYNLALKQAMMGEKLGLEKINLNTWVVENYYLSIGIINLFLVPLVMTRGIVEERKNRTWDLLLTYPISSWELALSKFLALFIGLGLVIFVVALFPVYLLFIAKLEVALLLSGFLGLLLSLAVMIAIALFTTYFTTNALTAGFLSFVVLIFLFSLQMITGKLSPALADYVLSLSPFTHLKHMVRGEIFYVSIFYYLSFTALCLYSLRQCIEFNREQG